MRTRKFLVLVALPQAGPGYCVDRLSLTRYSTAAARFIACGAVQLFSFVSNHLSHVDLSNTARDGDSACMGTLLHMLMRRPLEISILRLFAEDNSERISFQGSWPCNSLSEEFAALRDLDGKKYLMALAASFQNAPAARSTVEHTLWVLANQVMPRSGNAYP